MTRVAVDGRNSTSPCDLMVVSDVLDGGRERLDQEGMEAAGLRLGEVAVAALTA